MSINTTLLTPELYQYLLQISLREPPLLTELREESTQSFFNYAMQTAPEQAQLLALLVKLMQAKKVDRYWHLHGLQRHRDGIGFAKRRNTHYLRRG